MEWQEIDEIWRFARTDQYGRTFLHTHIPQLRRGCWGLGLGICEEYHGTTGRPKPGWIVSRPGYTGPYLKNGESFTEVVPEKYNGENRPRLSHMKEGDTMFVPCPPTFHWVACRDFRSYGRGLFGVCEFTARPGFNNGQPGVILRRTG